MSTRFPRAVAIIGAVFFIAVGIWAIGQDLGGTPAQDIPLFGAIAVVLLAAGALRWRNRAS